MKSFSFSLATIVALLCAGCMVGPDYFKPSVPMTADLQGGPGLEARAPQRHYPPR
jgi:hypothetical protein